MYHPTTCKLAGMKNIFPLLKTQISTHQTLSISVNILRGCTFCYRTAFLRSLYLSFTVLSPFWYRSVTCCMCFPFGYYTSSFYSASARAWTCIIIVPTAAKITWFTEQSIFFRRQRGLKSESEAPSTLFCVPFCQFFCSSASFSSRSIRAQS